jgi:hypothetical protein
LQTTYVVQVVTVYAMVNKHVTSAHARHKEDCFQVGGNTDAWDSAASLMILSPILDPFNPPVLYMGLRWEPLLSGKLNCSL